MRAAIYEEFKTPLTIQNVPDPNPDEQGVVIEVKATGLCLSDWHGWMGHDPDVSVPHVPGHELAGEIAAVGEGAVLVGVIPGLFLESRYVQFDTRGSVSQKSLRYLVGIVTALVIKEGLKPLLGLMIDHTLYMEALVRIIRYFSLGLWLTAGAPWLFTVCVDSHRFERIMARRRWKVAQHDLSLLLFGIQDAALMAENMVIAAESLGLGSCFLGGVPYQAESIIKKRKLPKRVFPLVGLVMGYPAENPPPRPRYPLEFTLFEDEYPDLWD